MATDTPPTWIWAPWDNWRDACLELGLTRNQRRFVLVIARMVEMSPAGRETLSCDPARSTLVEAIGGKVDQKAVKRIAEWFADRGLLHITQGGGSHLSRTVYRITPPSQDQGAQTPAPCPLSASALDRVSGGISTHAQGALGRLSGGILARDREPKAESSREAQQVEAETPAPSPAPEEPAEAVSVQVDAPRCDQRSGQELVQSPLRGEGPASPEVASEGNALWPAKRDAGLRGYCGWVQRCATPEKVEMVMTGARADAARGLFSPVLLPTIQAYADEHLAYLSSLRPLLRVVDGGRR
jgi:hypothetical protein